MSLYQKHRPKELEEIVGNAAVVRDLKSYLNKPIHPHVFLFSGASGCGKTSLARIMATKLGCQPQDTLELNSANFRGIDTIRDIIQQARLTSIGGGKKAWIIDECHMQTKEAQSAFLKLLEDTPDHVYFFLATTEPQKLLKTVINRCVHFIVQPLPKNRIMYLLQKVCDKEGKEISTLAKESIADSSNGCPRMALNLLEKIFNLKTPQQEQVTEQAVKESNEIIDLCRALTKEKKEKKWPEISKILKGLQDKDPEQVRLAVLGYCNKVLLNEDNPNAFLIMDSFKEPFYNSGHAGLTRACYQSLFE